ncbi:MAG: TlpA family protein disulfide reductase [Verrucomicrobiales bacterium]
MKTIPSTVAAVLLAAFFALDARAAENVQQILERLEKEKIEALSKYLEAHPEAPDSSEALGSLIAAYEFLGEEGKTTELLEQKYAGLAKSDDADLQDLIGRTVHPLVNAHIAAGNKDAALAFIERVRSDLTSHKMATEINQFLDQLTQSADQLKPPAIGDSMEIAFTSANGGEAVDLAEMKGKVVLVDFWATWCGPCVSEMPNVIAAYKKYHDRGFEIVGISLDQDKDTLMGFIEEHKMPWPQYFDGKGWENDLAGKYGIRGIPATFLIGKDGKIAATDLRGGALEAELEKLLK